jgi:formiminoglutamase
MLQNWLKPLPKPLLKKATAMPPSRIGGALLPHQAQMPDLKKAKVALIGVGDKAADAIRAQLYGYVANFPAGTVADLGNLRKPEAAQIIPVVYELLSGKVLPILLADDDTLARAQFLAYQDAKALVNLAVVDERCRFGTAEETYAPLLQPRHPLLFHLGMVGVQAHQTAADLLDFMGKNHFDLVRLGKSKAAIEETEPVLRDADLVAFHLGALKSSEVPAVAAPSPSGYLSEEACQLCRYAGMSDKLSSFGIYGYRAEADASGQTAQVVSQMVWYFLEGFFNRKKDYPVSTAGLTEYVVDFRKMNYQITFWKSAKTGRWWMQVPLSTQKKHERHRLIPCSWQDYQAACREELPDRLMQALLRF